MGCGLDTYSDMVWKGAIQLLYPLLRQVDHNCCRWSSKFCRFWRPGCSQEDLNMMQTVHRHLTSVGGCCILERLYQGAVSGEKRHADAGCQGCPNYIPMMPWRVHRNINPYMQTYMDTRMCVCVCVCCTLCSKWLYKLYLSAIKIHFFIFYLAHGWYCVSGICGSLESTSDTCDN